MISSIYLIIKCNLFMFNMTVFREYILSTMAGIIFVSMMAIFIFGESEPGITVIKYLGVLLWFIASIFGIVPILEFKMKGGVKKGDSYVRTTKLVDTGIYSIVRHPQYLSWPLLFISLMLMNQTHLMILLGLIGSLLSYYDTRNVDEKMVSKFGEQYISYMERVPKMNFIIGIYRRIKGR